MTAAPAGPGPARRRHDGGELKCRAQRRAEPLPSRGEGVRAPRDPGPLAAARDLRHPLVDVQRGDTQILPGGPSAMLPP